MNKSIDLAHFATRYIAMWNVTGSIDRNQLVKELWAEDAKDYLMSKDTLFQGLNEITSRVEHANERYVVQEGCLFRAGGNIAGNHHALKLRWEMSSGKGTILAAGQDLLILNDVGRIREAYQFLEP